VCTFVLLHRPGAAWPLLAAANRDEMLARPWQPPAAHWPDHPGIIGGLDTLAGGTWLAVNAHRMVAGVLNRTGSLGPAAGKRSRGDLPLMALAHDSATAAATTAATWNGGDWRSFNLVIADPTDAYFIRGTGEGPVQVTRLPPGLSMVTASDPNDTANPRVARHLPAFESAPVPEPPDWGAWPGLLASSEGDWSQTLNVPPRGGFGTASSALIGIRPGRTVFQFAAGPPGQAAFKQVVLSCKKEPKNSYS
jgi:hypothetical protein